MKITIANIPAVFTHVIMFKSVSGKETIVSAIHARNNTRAGIQARAIVRSMVVDYKLSPNKMEKGMFSLRALV